MERIGIIEMAMMDLVQDQKVAATKSLKESKNQFAFVTLLKNDFQAIPEGFTGVYMRRIECHIVPNALLSKIKMMAIGGFEHIPEDHELRLLADRYSPEGNWLNVRIIELISQWMDENL